MPYYTTCTYDSTRLRVLIKDTRYTTYVYIYDNPRLESKVGLCQSYI